MPMKTTSWQGSYANYLWKNIPDLGALLIIDKQGKIIERRNSELFNKEYNIRWLEKISKKISLRFGIKNFDKEMEGLQLTINMFKNFAMVVKPLKHNLLVLIVPTTKVNLPDWIRKNTQWWADDLVFEKDFVEGLDNLG